MYYEALPKLWGLKIPSTQVGAGSTPAPSILEYQYFKDKFIVANRALNAVRTQFLRTRPESTSIIKVGKASRFVPKFSQHLISSCGTRGSRGNRERFSPQTSITKVVARVAISVIQQAFIVKFLFQLRKYCVIPTMDHKKTLLNTIIDLLTQGIMNPLRQPLNHFYSIQIFVRCQTWELFVNVSERTEANLTMRKSA